jgi:hypothetical protein
MNLTLSRKVLATGGALLAASSLLLAGCSKHGDDSADYGGADPAAVTRATDSAEAGASGPAAAASGAPVSSSSVVSTARTVPSEAGGVGPSPSLAGDASPPASAPVAGSPSLSAQDGATTGRATGPRS